MYPLLVTNLSAGDWLLALQFTQSPTFRPTGIYGEVFLIYLDIYAEKRKPFSQKLLKMAINKVGDHTGKKKLSS